MTLTHSSELPRDSPVWRPGELGGPGGRLQTISMLPRGQVTTCAVLKPELAQSCKTEHWRLMQQKDI